MLYDLQAFFFFFPLSLDTDNVQVDRAQDLPGGSHRCY